MTKKPHDVVWHKKKAKFLSSAMMKPHHDVKCPDAQGKQGDRRERFARSLTDKIKRAVDGGRQRPSA